MINLTKEERDKFTAWLEQDASSTEGLMEQMKKLPNMSLIIQKKHVEVMSQRIVAKLLQSIEDSEI